MNTINKTCLEIELHCLEPAFKHLRLSNPKHLNHLTLLIEQQSQQVPVVVVAAEKATDNRKHWILIDGYTRVDALKRLGCDTVQAEVWDCKIPEALLATMAQQQNRNWMALEEAMLLQELQRHYHLSQADIARRAGRSKTWVSHRLLLIESMSDNIRDAVRSGIISPWVAVRIVEPFARANAQHANAFLSYLKQHHHSSRELEDFFSHYKNSSNPVRENLVEQPALYFQSKRTIAKDKAAKQFAPEIQRLWFEPLKLLKQPLSQLLSGFDKSFYDNQPKSERQSLMNVFEPIRQQFHLLETKLEEMCYGQSRKTSDDSMPA